MSSLVGLTFYFSFRFVCIPLWMLLPIYQLRRLLYVFFSSLFLCEHCYLIFSIMLLCGGYYLFTNYVAHFTLLSSSIPLWTLLPITNYGALLDLFCFFSLCFSYSFVNQTTLFTNYMIHFTFSFCIPLWTLLPSIQELGHETLMVFTNTAILWEGWCYESLAFTSTHWRKMDANEDDYLVHVPLYP